MEDVSIIGAGQMGSGIAEVFAISGYRVRVLDLTQEIFEKSHKRILESLKKLESKCLIDSRAEHVQERISYHTDAEALAGSNIFIESTFEDFSIKRNILSKVSEIITENTYVASNTSSYSITELSRFVPWPEKFIGFHFMNPPPIMSLVEVISGLRTSHDTFNFFWNLAKKLQKIPIASKNSPGFVLNRVLIPMINEAIYALYEKVSSAEEIDAAMRLGANHPIGPLALADLIGLDTVLSILTTLKKELGEEKYAPCPLLEEFVSNGFLGKKTGRGFYKYSIDA